MVASGLGCQDAATMVVVKYLSPSCSALHEAAVTEQLRVVALQLSAPSSYPVSAWCRRAQRFVLASARAAAEKPSRARENYRTPPRCRRVTIGTSVGVCLTDSKHLAGDRYL